MGISSGQGESEGDPSAPAAPNRIVERVIARDLEPVPSGIQEDLDRWAQHRAEIGKGLGASAIRALLAEARRDPAAFRERVTLSITNGTTVLLEASRCAPGARGGFGTAHGAAAARRAAKAAAEFPEPDPVDLIAQITTHIGPTGEVLR